MARPRKPPEEKLVTLSVRVPRSSVDMLERVVEGERSYLEKRQLPSRGVTRSEAFRTIWDLGQTEYLLQRATLWVTRKHHRYSVDTAAHLLGWDADALRHALAERGVKLAGDEPATRAAPAPAPAPDIDRRFLV